MSTQAVKVVGISLENGKFHLRSSRSTKIGVWLDPGEGSFKMVKLPHEMSKVDAIAYLKTQKDFQNKKIQDFLNKQYERRQQLHGTKQQPINKLRHMIEKIVEERLETKTSSYKSGKDDNQTQNATGNT